jgi:hypothetical protein
VYDQKQEIFRESCLGVLKVTSITGISSRIEPSDRPSIEESLSLLDSRSGDEERTR